MRCIIYVVFIPLLSALSAADSSTSVELQSTAVNNNVIAPMQLLTKEARRERRKERRILRKKKQRLRELREEIRILTLSLQQSNSTVVSDKAEVKLKQKGRQGRKGIKWRKSLLEKLKGIVRRLDRMERRLVEGNQIVSSEMIHPMSNTSSTSSTTTTTTSTTSSINETVNQKLKRIQPAISRSRSGENGAVCSAHKDCRPGHCCHRLIVSKNETKSTCVLHRLLEGGECVDGCQCSTQLNCFLPESKLSRNITVDNMECQVDKTSALQTSPPFRIQQRWSRRELPNIGEVKRAFCKKAASSDILAGSYLYQKDAVIVDSDAN